MKRMNKGLSFFMSFLLCFQGLNFSMLANAEESKAARIIEFNSLDEKIAFQTLQIGAGIDDVVFPDSIKAIVETTEKESANNDFEKETSKESVEKVDQTDKTEKNFKTVKYGHFKAALGRKSTIFPHIFGGLFFPHSTSKAIFSF